MSSLVGVADRLQQFTGTRTALPADSPMTPRPCRPQQNVPILLVHQQLRYCAAPVGVKVLPTTRTDFLYQYQLPRLVAENCEAFLGPTLQSNDIPRA